MQVPYTNHTDRPTHVGGKRILPGETRMVDAAAVRRPSAGAPSEPEPDTRLADLLEGNVDAVTAALDELGDDDLAQLEMLEHAGKARKGVLEALAAEQLERADARSAGGDGEAAAE